MTPRNRDSIAGALLGQFLGGLGLGTYGLHLKHLYGAPESSAIWTFQEFLVFLAAGCAAVLAAGSAVSFLLARRTDRGWSEIFRRDSKSNAILALLLLDPLLNTNDFLALSAVYNGVFVAGLLAAAKVLLFTGMKAGPTVSEPANGAGDRCFRFAWVASGVYFLVFGTLAVLQCRALCVQHIDSVTFEQMYWNTLHGHFAVSDMSDPPFTADHVAVTMYVFLPLYAMFPALEAVALFQTAGIGLGGVPAYLISKELLGHRGAALAMSVAYLASPALHYSNLEVRDNVFDPNSFSATLILWTFYLGLRGRWRLFAFSAAAAMLCREDVCPSIFMMGLYFAIVRKQWRPGVAASATAAAWLALCLYVIVPHFRGRQSLVFGYFTGMGGSLAEMILFVLRHPLETLLRITTETDVQFVLELMLPFGLLAFLAPEALLMAGPAFALSLLADPGAEELVSIQFWYHIIHIPLVYIASVLGARRLAHLIPRAAARWPRRFPGFDAGDAPGRLACAAAAMALACSFSLSSAVSKWPLSFSFYNPSDSYRHYSRYVPPPGARHIPSVQALIPRSATVTATHYLTQKFSHHRHVWRFPGHIDATGNTPEELADYIVINRRDRWFRLGFDTTSDQEAIQRLYFRPEFVKIFEADGIVVFQRRSHESPGAEE
ncbi:MAG: DUF2079 domain-containing protein [Planctomycetes bacterium]|nr:DUF2079 domain-containing protein [Planctomycetota bacterium]